MIPKISIITITYNSEKTLEDTIQSVVNQDYPSIEYLIIDGGSKDSTLDIVKKYREKIALVISEPDEGISDAFNKGIAHATGDIIGLINSDDLLLPGALAAIANNYDSQIDVYRGRTIVWDSETDDKLTAEPSMHFPLNSLKRRNICHQSTFISKQAYQKYGAFDKKLKYVMDVDLLTRFYNLGAVMKKIDANLAVSRLGGITDSFFMKMSGEVYYVERKNGGSIIMACMKYMYYVVYQCIKHTLFKIASPYTVRKFKYRKF